ncbi:MAG: hypothetical protein AAF320_01690, partial [Myxococcota bacterium]
ETPVATPILSGSGSDVEKQKKDATRELKFQTKQLIQSIKVKMISDIKDSFNSPGVLEYKKNGKLSDLEECIKKLSKDDSAEDISITLENAKNKTDEIESRWTLKFKKTLSKNLKALSSKMDEAMTELKLAVKVLEAASALMSKNDWSEAEKSIGKAAPKIQDVNLRDQAYALEEAAEHVVRQEWEQARAALKKTGI